MAASRNKNSQEQIDALYSAVPISGEIEYTALYDAMVASGNKASLDFLKHLKQTGRITVRVEHDGTKIQTFVRRVS